MSARCFASIARHVRIICDRRQPPQTQSNVHYWLVILNWTPGLVDTNSVLPRHMPPRWWYGLGKLSGLPDVCRVFKFQLLCQENAFHFHSMHIDNWFSESTRCFGWVPRLSSDGHTPPPLPHTSPSAPYLEPMFGFCLSRCNVSVAPEWLARHRQLFTNIDSSCILGKIKYANWNANFII